MFFRRERPAKPSFAARLEGLREAGFTVEPLAGGAARVSRGGCAAVVENAGDGPRLAARAGVLIEGEPAVLVDGGFQKFFRTASGKKKPALASELRALHAFEEDLKEALGLTSLYNESLGTVSASYRYDRLQGRDG